MRDSICGWSIKLRTVRRKWWSSFSSIAMCSVYFLVMFSRLKATLKLLNLEHQVWILNMIAEHKCSSNFTDEGQSCASCLYGFTKWTFASKSLSEFYPTFQIFKCCHSNEIEFYSAIESRWIRPWMKRHICTAVWKELIVIMVFCNTLLHVLEKLFCNWCQRRPVSLTLIGWLSFCDFVTLIIIIILITVDTFQRQLFYNKVWINGTPFPLQIMKSMQEKSFRVLNIRTYYTEEGIAKRKSYVFCLDIKILSLLKATKP